jgi:alpha/beta superfamily hydrolase
VRRLPHIPFRSSRFLGTAQDDANSQNRNRTFDEYGDVARLEKVVEKVRNAESVIVTGADHFFTKQLDAVEETMRGWAEEVLGT